MLFTDAPCSISMLARPRDARPFPYTTLFRSRLQHAPAALQRPARAICGCPGDRPAGNRGWLPLRLRDGRARAAANRARSEEHTSELQSLTNPVCRLLLEKKKR